MSETPYRILIVDDNPNNLFTLRSLLETLNHCQVVEADSGVAALGKVLEGEVHLILLDVQMPGMDGFEVAEHLKMTEKTRNIPVIFVTAVFKAEEFMKRGYAVGAVDYLTKPIDDNLLLNRIRHYQTLYQKEQELKRAIATLQEKEAIIIQQSRMAAAGEMLGAIAHQWRQPLNAMAIMIQDLRDAQQYGELDEPYLNNAVEKAMEQIGYMSRTIDDFRNFFKPDKNKESFNPRKIVDEALQIVSAQLRHHFIETEVRCICGHAEDADQCAVLVEGFPSELKQVILNIVNNAKDAIMERQENEEVQGLIRITLTLEEEKSRIRIEDNGGGMVPEVMGQIFQPYFTTKDEGKGTGIGLYMGKMIVEEHMGGKLTVENGEEGAAFIIQLPSTIPDAQ